MTRRATGIIDVQVRWRELGRLRLGKLEKGKGKPRPVRLRTWRLTSHSRLLLEHAAAAFGGEVREWTDAPTEGDNFELATTSESLPIVVPPGEVLSQAYEMWTGGGCKRRCGGPNEQGPSRQYDRDVACACPLDIGERMELAKDGKACKPTTRLSVILPDVPDIGVWRLESHGYNAAAELAGTYDLLRLATEKGQPIAARLTIQPRSSKREGQPRHDYVVPIIEIDARIGEVVEAIGAASMTPAERRSLPSPDSAPALSAPGTPSPSNGGGGRFPSPPPDPSAAPTEERGLPEWLRALDHDDGEIVDAANQVAAARGHAADMQGLGDVARLAVTEEAQQAIRERLEKAQVATTEVEPHQEPLA